MGDNDVKTFERNLTVNISRLVESYKELIAKSQISPADQPHMDSLQIAAAAANIAYAAQSLLDQIHQLRIRVVLRSDESSEEESFRQRLQLETALGMREEGTMNS